MEDERPVDGHDHLNRQSRNIISIGIIVLIALTLALPWLSLHSVSTVAIAVFDIDQSAGPDPGVNLREVARNGEVMYTHTVTVSADVHEIYSPHIMTIGSATPFFGSVLLIVSQVPFTPPEGESLGDDDIVRVTGVVQPFEVAALESQLGLDLPDSLTQQYDGKTVMVVESVSVDPPAGFGPGDKEFPFESDGWDVDVTIGDIVDDPEEHLGKTVTVSGEIEEGFVRQHAFRIGDAKLLVISPTPRNDLFIEPTAYVTGEVRRFDLTAVEQEFAIDLDNELLSKYIGGPVIIAAEVELVK